MFKQKGFANFSLFMLAIALLGTVGWVWNIVKIIGTGFLSRRRDRDGGSVRFPPRAPALPYQSVNPAPPERCRPTMERR